MTSIISPIAERNNGLTARTVPIDTPEGRRYIAQVNLNGNWHDVVDYHAVGRLERTRRMAKQSATQALATITLYWE
jgi:hypothetical protein